LLAPDYVEIMSRCAETAQTDLGLVHCGFRRLLPDGTIGPGSFAPSGDMFAPLTSYSCFANVSQCLIRRSLFHALGGFDPQFNPAEDWDLWLRMARMGIRMAGVSRALAYYRMRPGSMSRDLSTTLAAGWKVIELGHSSDSRVFAPLPVHARGLPRQRLHATLFNYFFWVAGIAIGAGRTCSELLDFEISPPARFDYDELATRLEYGLAHGSCSLPTPSNRSAISKFGKQVHQFLRELEEKLKVPHFAENFRL
jgi:hypothetical protein